MAQGRQSDGARQNSEEECYANNTLLSYRADIASTSWAVTSYHQPSQHPRVPTKPTATHPNADAFPIGLSGPALRALNNAGIRTMAHVATHTAAEIAALHGMGPKGVRALGEALAANGQQWRS